MAPNLETRAADAPRVELVLRLPDGAPWRLSVSAGVERFIGHYPRLDGIAGGGPLLEYRAVSTA
ncbi:MAG: hypothetical protein ACK40O_04775 [Allosphingosinicella sp.]